MAALVTSTLHLPQAHPKNKIPYIKLDSITENRKKKKHRFQRKVGGFIVAGSVFLFFVFFGCFFLFSVFVFFWWFCLLYRLSIGVVLP